MSSFDFDAFTGDYPVAVSKISIHSLVRGRTIAAKCPYKQRPMVEYLCFEHKCTSTTMKKQEAKNDGR